MTVWKTSIPMNGKMIMQKAYSTEDKQAILKYHPTAVFTELEHGVWYGCPDCQQEVQYPHKCGGL